jgi:hypothetical protein
MVYLVYLLLLAQIRALLLLVSLRLLQEQITFTQFQRMLRCLVM